MMSSSPVGSSVVPHQERPEPSFLPPEPPEPLPFTGYVGGTGAWPGEWLIERDELRRATTVKWQGSTESTYPWGHRNHIEKIIYEASDDRPDISSVQGETETSFDLNGRKLTWRALFEVRSDRIYFYYSYTRLLFENSEKIREKSWEERIRRDFQ